MAKIDNETVSAIKPIKSEAGKKNIHVLYYPEIKPPSSKPKAHLITKKQAALLYVAAMLVEPQIKSGK